MSSRPITSKRGVSKNKIHRWIRVTKNNFQENVEEAISESTS